MAILCTVPTCDRRKARSNGRGSCIEDRVADAIRTLKLYQGWLTDEQRADLWRL